MPTTPPRKQATIIPVACLGENPPSIKEFFDEGSMLYSAENSWTPSVTCGTCCVRGGQTYHNTKAQTERRGEKAVTVLDSEVLLAWKLPYEDVDAYY